jgi:hypothetical protein
LPHVGPFGGDDTTLEICCDCGQIIDWEPITDEALISAFCDEDDEGGVDGMFVKDPNAPVHDYSECPIEPTFDLMRLIRERGKAQ